MRRFMCVCLAVVLAGCGGSADQANPPADTAALVPAPAAFSLADVAGTWNVQVMPEGKDTVLLNYQLTATADTAGWSIKLPDRADPIPLHVMPVQGDSVVIHAGPYSSALRKNVQVSTEGVFRLQNGMLTGRTTAHYSGGQDTVVVLRTSGTKAQ